MHSTLGKRNDRDGFLHLLIFVLCGHWTNTLEISVVQFFRTQTKVQSKLCNFVTRVLLCRLVPIESRCYRVRAVNYSEELSTFSTPRKTLEFCLGFVRYGLRYFIFKSLK